MGLMRRLLGVLILAMLAAAPAWADEAVNGWCVQGAEPVVTSGLTSTTLVQLSAPSCTVTVYVHGGGLATIYSDNSSTPLANPFTANSNGQWQWYAANGRYDVAMSGGALTGTVTISDILLADPTGGSLDLSSIIAATGSNSINSGNNGAQVWNWALTSASLTAFTFGEATAASGSGDLLVAVKTLAGSTAVPLTVTDSLTGSQTLPALSLGCTWNTTGVVDACLLVNATNTASGAGSLLADLQVGGSSKWSLDKSGNEVLAGTLTINGFALSTSGTTLSLGSNATLTNAGALTVVSCTGCSGSTTPPISSLTAAAASNTIANGNYPQVWNWAQTTAAQAALTLGETTASTGTGNIMLAIGTLTHSSTIPLSIVQGTNGPTGSNAPDLFDFQGAAGGLASSTTSAGLRGASANIYLGNGSQGGSSSGNGGNGGTFTLYAGSGGNTNGSSNNGGSGGGILLYTNSGGTGGTAGTGGSGGTFYIQTGDGGYGNTGGVGGAWGAKAGLGGSANTPNGVGGAGGSIIFQAGAGGASAGTGNNAAGGDVLFEPGVAGTGGSGTTARPGELQLIAGTVGGSLTSSFMLLSGTWNTSGVVDAAFKMNVTNTASGTGSLLMDLQAGSGGTTSEFTVSGAGLASAQHYATLSPCAAVGSAASPSLVACGAAASGLFSCATAASGATCVISTTAVTATSLVFVQEADTAAAGTALGVTCNTGTTVVPTSRLLATVTASTSFTINLGTVTTNPACFQYFIVN